MKYLNQLLYSFAFILFVCFLSACSSEASQESADTSNPPVTTEEFTILSLMGDTLIPASPSEALMGKVDSIRSIYDQNPEDQEMMIWMGRYEAYSGNYEGALDIYQKGSELFPEDPRFLRHRGHRYISIRRFDEAIADLTKAAEMIEGTENEVEPDGMPNARGIPVSTLHGNIYYHLGLAHYLKQNWEPALQAYTLCKESGSLPDNLVSSTHWLYMISRRLGQTHEEASRWLEDIVPGMDIIENTAYYNLCLFYKGELSEMGLLGGEDAGPSNDAVLYGLGNWYLYNGDQEKAKEIFQEILGREGWNSFGFIAAESDWVANFQ